MCRVTERCSWKKSAQLFISHNFKSSFYINVHPLFFFVCLFVIHILSEPRGQCSMQWLGTRSECLESRCLGSSLLLNQLCGYGLVGLSLFSFLPLSFFICEMGMRLEGTTCDYQYTNEMKISLQSSVWNSWHIEHYPINGSCYYHAAKKLNYQGNLNSLSHFFLEATQFYILWGFHLQWTAPFLFSTCL